MGLFSRSDNKKRKDRVMGDYLRYVEKIDQGIASGSISKEEKWGLLNTWITEKGSEIEGTGVLQSFTDAKTQYDQDTLAETENTQSKEERNKLLYGGTDEDGNKIIGLTEQLTAQFDRDEERWNLMKAEDLRKKGIYDDMMAEVNMPDADKEMMLADAESSVTAGFDKARSMGNRAMERKGVNPNSGAYQSLNKDMSLSQAALSAGAKNKTRRYINDVRDRKLSNARAVAMGYSPNQITMRDPGLDSLNSAGFGINMFQGQSDRYQNQQNQNRQFGLADASLGFQKDKWGDQKNISLINGVLDMTSTLGAEYIARR